MIHTQTIRQAAFGVLALIVSGGSMLVVAGPAHARSALAVQAGAVSTVAVHVADLDAGTVAGRAILDARIRLAARQVCAVETRDLRAQRAASACVSDAIGHANIQLVARAALPMLAANAARPLLAHQSPAAIQSQVRT